MRQVKCMGVIGGRNPCQHGFGGRPGVSDVYTPNVANLNATDMNRFRSALLDGIARQCLQRRGCRESNPRNQLGPRYRFLGLVGAELWACPAVKLEKPKEGSPGLQ